MNILKKNLALFLPLGLFSVLFLPFITAVPLLDGNIDFVQAHLFSSGGFDKYFSQFGSIHPPLKIFLLSGFYRIFGENQISFNLVGYAFGIMGITAAYFIGSKLSSKFVGLLFSLLLAFYPLYLASGLFGLTDFLFTNLLLMCILFYSLKKYFLFSMFLTLTVLCKETGLLALGLFFLIDVLFSIKNLHKKIHKIFAIYLSPVLAYAIWTYFLKTSGKGAWKDWIFTDTAEKGTFYTITYNILSLRIFNEYAIQHYLQLLLLNYNWVIIFVSLLVSLLYFSNLENRKHFRKTLKGGNKRTILFIALFCFSYALTVLTLQTYTIPRYGLPITPFILLWFAVIVAQLKHALFRWFFIIAVSCVLALGLVTSVDPLAKSWGTISVLGQSMYDTDLRKSGNDGIAYNFQYLVLSKIRSDFLYAPRESISKTDCFWLTPDPNNDYQTFTVLHIDNSLNLKKCTE